MRESFEKEREEFDYMIRERSQWRKRLKAEGG